MAAVSLAHTVAAVHAGVCRGPGHELKGDVILSSCGASCSRIIFDFME